MSYLVLQYLEGMSRDSANVTPPLSMKSNHRAKSPRSPNGWDSGSGVYAPTPKSSMRGAQQLEELAAAGNVEDDEDVKSDEQEGQRSELGTVLPIVGYYRCIGRQYRNLLQREPGPHDPPGPHYESFDSGPSFGNFGPLPPDNHASNNIFSTWQQVCRQ